ncbi:MULTISPECIES: hypothetical protein [Vibrio]|uniref:hypothetical protein n=1 Tax=Vibrio TaxID=662 RepID=UPI001F1172B2|nr:hypothetical protein [Vibrio tasmaniensis]
MSFATSPKTKLTQQYITLLRLSSESWEDKYPNECLLWPKCVLRERKQQAFDAAYCDFLSIMMLKRLPVN